MALSKEEIINLAHLAKLELSPEEIKTYQVQLSDVLTYVEKINKLDLAKVKESLSGAEDSELILRPDEVLISYPNIINQACDLEDDYVATPQALKKK